MLKATSNWLKRAPADDPVDRRNAPFVQVLLILFGTLIPLNKGLYLYAGHPAVWHDGAPLLWVDLATDVLIVLSAWTGVYLVRQGRFRAGVTQFLSVLLLSMAAAYAGLVLSATNLSFDPMPLLLLAVAGLVMGRRTLWMTLAALLLILALCLALSLATGAKTADAGPSLAGRLFSMAVIYLLISIVLDRTVTALRDSLAESQAHRRDLIQANLRLEAEKAERERTREQLIQAKKVEAIGMLASGVAHDFDNVLSVVLGYTGRRERIADSGEQALVGALENVEVAARRALAINRKLLNLGRQEVYSPEILDLPSALRSTLPMVRQLFSHSVRVDPILDSGPLPVLFDAGRFELLVLNIASNARDAMPQGGSFTITAARSANGMDAEIHLRDTGEGMSPAVQQRVFESFFTTKPRGHGTGLGLSMVRDMVDEAGGHIRIDSVAGAGCTIVVTLPLVREAR